MNTTARLVNGRWLRENLSVAEFANRVAAWAFNREYLMPIAAVAKPRISVLSDLGPLTAFFFSGELPLTPADFEDKKVSFEVMSKAFSRALEEFDALNSWNQEAIATLFKQLSEECQLKLRDFLRPFYVAIAGTPTSTPLFDSMEILGRDLCRARVRRALEVVKTALAAD